MSAAVALANLDIFEEEKLNEHVREELAAVPRRRSSGCIDLPIVGDVRGDGYFFGIELVKDKATKETFDDDESERLLRGFLSKALFDAGLYCRADDRGDPVVQLAPPLTIGQREFDEIEGILRGVLTEAWTRSVSPTPRRSSFWLDDAGPEDLTPRAALPGDIRGRRLRSSAPASPGSGPRYYLLEREPELTRGGAREGDRRLRRLRPQRRLVLGPVPALGARRSRAARPGRRAAMRRRMIDTVDEVGRAGAAARHRLRLREGRHRRVRAIGVRAARRRGRDRGRRAARR